VARNLVRRRLKEIWRRDLMPRVVAWDVVVRTNRSAYRASFDGLRDDMRAWQEVASRESRVARNES
jgi:ribonuclease P protein component